MVIWCFKADKELLELLVKNSIIEPKLTIQDVFQQIHKKISPMRVTYRLAGVGGEATENFVNNLKQSQEISAQKEKNLFGVLTKDVAEGVNGVKLMI